MIAPRWRKVLRDVALHRARTVLVIVAIAVGIIGAGAVLDTWALVRRATGDEYRASLPASATLRVDAIDDALIARVRALPGVADAQGWRSVIATMVTASGPRTAVLFAVDHPTDVRIGLLKPEAGAWPAPDGTVVIERSSVEFATAAIGDAMTVRVGNGPPRALRVSGIARDVGLAPGWMEHVVYGFVTPATLASLGAPPTFDQLRLRVSDPSLNREAVRRLAETVASGLGGAGANGRSYVVTDVNVPEPGEHIHAAQMNSLLYTQGAFGALALVLSGILVFNLITAMLAGQVREIGVMKTVGARSAQIAAMYLGLALVLGIAATAVALPAAALIGRAYAVFTADLLNFDVTGIAIPRGVLLLQIAVGAALPVCAAALPVLRGSRLTVAEALRDTGISGHGGGGRWLGRVTGLSRPALMSIRNAFRRRQRMALTLGTLAMGGAVYLGALNLRASILGAVGRLYDAQRFDAIIRFSRSWPPDSLEAALRRIPGVGEAEAWGAARATVARPDGLIGNAFPITAPPPGTARLVYPMADGRWLRAGDTNALVVTPRLMADEPGLAPGREATLVIDGRSTRWHVVGVAEAGPMALAFAPREAVAALADGGRVDRAVVRAGPAGEGATTAFMLRLRGALARDGFDVRSTDLVAESRGVLEDHLLLVGGFLGVMGQLMLVVGGLGLATTMSLAVLERTREIGVMRAIGARHGAIFALLQIEGLVIALVSWAVAIPLSLPMSIVLGRAFGRIMLPVPLTLVPDAAGVARWLGLAVAVSLASCAWPAWRALRTTTREALAWE